MHIITFFGLSPLPCLISSYPALPSRREERFRHMPYVDAYLASSKGGGIPSWYVLPVFCLLYVRVSVCIGVYKSGDTIVVSSILF